MRYVSFFTSVMAVVFSAFCPAHADELKSVKSWTFTSNTFPGEWYFPGGNPKADADSAVYYTGKDSQPGPRLLKGDFKAIDISHIRVRMRAELQNPDKTTSPARFKELRLYWSRPADVKRDPKWPFINVQSVELKPDAQNADVYIGDVSTHGNWLGDIVGLFISIKIADPAPGANWAVRLYQFEFLTDFDPAQTVTEAKAAPEKVIMVVLDSLRADHLQCYGYGRPTSPWLDSFAAQGAVFTRAVAASDGTQRSVPAVMTGRYFSQLFEKPVDSDGIPSAAVTMAELFAQMGFRTAAWSTNPHISKATQYDQGFSQFRELDPNGTFYARIEQVIRDIRKSYTPTGSPEFLYVHLMDTHWPYFPPDPFCTMFSSADYSGVFLKDGLVHGADGRELIGNLPYWSENHDIQQADIEHIISQYDGEIRYSDAHLAELLQAFNFDPEKDLAIILADHGEQFFEHNFLGHNMTTPIEELRVPLIFRGKGISSGRVDAWVSQVDILPTLCELYQLNLPTDLPGKSLLPAMRGETAPARPIFAEGSDERGPAGVVIADDTFYYLNTRANSVKRPWEVWPIQELMYDLTSDAVCARNIIGERLPQADGMLAKLRELNKRFANCVPDALARNHGEITFGRNLLPEIAPGTVISDQVPLDLAFTVDEVDTEYVLEMEYTMEKGDFAVRVISDDRQAYYYSYHLLRPQPQGRSFTVAVYPKTAKCRFAAACVGGAATLNKLAFRRANVPDIAMVPAPGSAQSFPRPELTQEEKRRLEALGYFQ